MGYRINKFLHILGGAKDKLHVLDNKQHKADREQLRENLLNQRNDYSKNYGVVSGFGQRRLRKINLKSNLRSDKINYKAQKKQERLQKRWSQNPIKYYGIRIGLILLFVYLIFLGNSYDTFQWLESQNIIGETEEAFEETGVSHQLDVVGKILSGDFEPETLWESETVQSEYAVPEEFDIIVEDIDPLKESFRNGEPIYIGGRINLISGFDKTTTVSITAEPTDFCAESSQETWDTIKEETKINSLLEFFDSDNEDEELVGCSDGTDWECYISGSDEINIFHMERVYNRQFYCNHTGVEVDETEVISGLDVNWEYATSAVAGKQIYAFDPEIVSSYDGDPLDLYEVDSDSLRSWYIGDKQINIGLGLSGSTDYVRSENSDDIFKDINHLAITIQNTGSGKISEIESLSISFPNTVLIEVADEIEDPFDSEVNFRGPTTEVITIKGQDIVTRKFTLSKEEIEDFEFIEPADHVTYYIPFVVKEEYVGDSAFQSFLVKADILYKYKDRDSLSVNIRP
jgi:hypothetical protein